MLQVLIVDDERPVHQAIKALVDWPRFHAHAPASAFDGEEALRLMTLYCPEIVFVDMNMPVMDGVTFLKKASQEFPSSQFIVVSGYDDFTYAKAAITSGALDYLLKPIDADELNKVLQKAVERCPDNMTDARRPTDIAHDVKSYIDGNYQALISLDALAERFHFSREYLNRVFRAEYGMAIYEYVQKVRMESARQMLKSNRPLQDIAVKLGFSNANYFSKAFKKYFGYAPREYRESGARNQASNGKGDTP